MGLGPAASPRQFSPFAESARLRNYIAKVKGVQTANLIDFWYCNDASLPTCVDGIASARNATYVNIPTLQAATFADGANLIPAFNGSTQYVNTFTSNLASAWSAAEGTLLVWVKMASSDWTSATGYGFAALYVDGNNQVAIYKPSASTLQWKFTGGGATSARNKTSFSSASWLPLVLTWSTLNSRVRAYINGVQEGADLAMRTIVGSLSIATIAALPGPASQLKGNAGMGGLWTKELIAAEALTISTAL